MMAPSLGYVDLVLPASGAPWARCVGSCI